ncbi:isoprenylcysteine carboxylmethyltransferase family protein [Pedobacter nototheniae]|uniref:methyltransferase family protein n=1 Tax=Pedobacter nototheniae TaxID=2488994 RepID=UPI00292D6EF0|nr:isoprenylcysteine carboxylmethyltransferase family protein [Pedobacter nototheniae]
MHLINKYFPLIFGLFFLLTEIHRNVKLRNKGERKNTGADKNSLTILWVTIGISMFLGGFLTQFERTRITIFQPYWFYFGVLIALAGFILRFVAIQQLGKSFTVDVQIAENQQLKQDGLYATLRHPSYTGALMAFLGLAITFSNWLSLIVICIPVFLAFIYRISIEEGVLKAEFGNDYVEYCKKTKRLIPYLY